MKTPRTLLVGLGLLSFSFTGCATNPTAANTTTANLQAFAVAVAPAIAQAIEARLVLNYLSSHPDRADTFQIIADDLTIAKNVLGGEEITEQTIRDFAHREAVKLALMPGEENIVADFLLTARSQFLISAGTSTVLSSDPRVGVWISAIANGITDAVTELDRRAAAAK